MTTPIRTDLIRAKPTQRAKSPPRALFTDHPIAKLSAVGLAMVLLFLIHREMTVTLFEGDVNVVLHPGSSNEIVIQTEGRYYIEVMPPKTVSLEVKGIARKSNQFSQPVQVTAFIPRERLVGLGDGEIQREVTIEPSDLGIAGVRDVSFSTLDPSPKVRVIVYRQAEVRLLATIQATEGESYDVRFEPPMVVIEGPATMLGFAGSGADDPTLNLAVPAREGIHDVALPVALVDGGVSLLPGQTVQAHVTRRDQGPLLKRLNLKVGIQIAQRYGSEYAFTLGEPLGSGGLLDVVLVGPPDVVDRIIKDSEIKDRLAHEIQLLVLCEAAAWEHRSELQEPGSSVEAEVRAMVVVPEAVRQEFQLVPEKATRDIPGVRIQRLEAQQSGERDGG